MSLVFWKDYLNLFLKIPTEKLKFPIIIGGDSHLYDFYGFFTIGNRKQYTPMEGYDALNILKELPEEILSSEVPKEEFIADKFGIGINKTCFFYKVILLIRNLLLSINKHAVDASDSIFKITFADTNDDVKLT